ncbi:MAG TPA: radical SAM protein [Povalibacter sp.]|nr:radical SAM protein [Povalibacter sp.]
MSAPPRQTARPGRGAVSNPEGRFELTRAEAVDDGWGSLDEPLPPLETTVRPEPARSIISRNKSPDIPFDQSINPYRGCEHGCIYCYARPSHGYLNLSPGLDFETRLFYKPDAARLLENELAAPGYRCSPITIGANTDPYQPIERDVELLAQLARERLVLALMSVTTLSNELKRTLEPRTASPAARLRAIRTLSAAGVPVGVMVAPVIPVLTDSELEKILEAAAEAGARSAGYVLLRLPYEVKDLFRQWLDQHEPLKAKHVLSRMQAMRSGRDYDSRWGVRQRGEGEYAQLLNLRFKNACRKYGLTTGERFVHDTSAFRPPLRGPQQLTLL